MSATTRRRAETIGLILLLFGSATWAVTGVTIAVNDVQGNGIAGVTLTLTPVSAAQAPITATTSSSGEAAIDSDLPAGEYRVTVDGKKYRSIYIREGQTSYSTGPLPISAAAPNVVGLGISEDDVPDADLTLSQDTVTDTTPDGSSTTVNDRDLGEANRDFAHRVNVKCNPCASASIALRGRGGSNANANQRAAFFLQTGSAGGGAGGGSNAEGRRFHPSLLVKAGEADVSLEFIREGGGTHNTFKESGFLWGLGFDARFDLSGEEGGWFAGVTYLYEEVEDLTTTRDPPIRAGGGIVSETDELRYKAHTIDGYTGFRFRHFTPWAGVRAKNRRMTLEGVIDVDFSPLFGGIPITRRIEFVNEVEEDSVQGVAGLDIHFAKRLVARLEGATDGDNDSYSASLGIGF